MADMFDYLDWYGDFGYDVVPFNEVDNLILSQLSYVDLTNIVPPLPQGVLVSDTRKAADLTELGVGYPLPPSVSVSQAAEAYEKLHPADNPEDLGPLLSKRTRTLLGYMAKGKRYAGARLSCYAENMDPDTHEQFGAVTISLPDGGTFVSFRGTDDSLVGWIEDCETSYRIVPSQTDALAYLDYVGLHTAGPLQVGGHSKGGNLAAYASSRCKQEIQDRITHIWCNDSPGFEDSVAPLSSFDCVRDRISFFTPEYSVVGSILSQVVEPVIVVSNGNRVMEHSATNWQVMRGSLIRGAGYREASLRIREAFAHLVDSHDLEGRKKLLDGWYASLTERGINSMTDMFATGFNGVAAAMGSITALEDDDRDAMSTFLFGVMNGAVVGEMNETVSETVAPAARQISENIGDALSAMGKNAREFMENLADKRKGKPDHDDNV